MQRKTLLTIALMTIIAFSTATQASENGSKRGFKGSDEELQVLVDWLLEQKAEPSQSGRPSGSQRSSQAPAMAALNSYLVLTGETQGEVQGSCTQAGREGKMEIYGTQTQSALTMNENVSRTALHTNFRLSAGGEYLAARKNGTSARNISVAMPTTMYGNKQRAGSLRQRSSVQYKETDLNFVSRQARKTTSVWDDTDIVHKRKRPGRAKCKMPGPPAPFVPTSFPNIARSSDKTSGAKAAKPRRIGSQSNRPRPQKHKRR